MERDPVANPISVIHSYLQNPDIIKALEDNDEKGNNAVELLAILGDINRFLARVHLEEKYSEEVINRLKRELMEIPLNKRAGFLDSTIALKKYSADRKFIALVDELLPCSKKGLAQKKILLSRLDPYYQIRTQLLKTKAQIEKLLGAFQS